MAIAEPQPGKAELLAREAIERPRAMWAAIASAVLGFASSVLVQFSSGDLPTVTVLDVLNTAVGNDVGRPGLRSEQLVYFDDHAVAFIATAVLQGAAALLFAFVLITLFRAAVARGGRVPRIAQVLAAAGGIAAALGTIGLQVGVQVNVRSAIADQNWLAGPADGSIAHVSQLLLLISILGLAMSTVFIGLGAMRVGLLTKFIGWLGVGVGASLVLSLASASGAGFNIFQIAWVALVGAALSGRGPSGRPPAWDDGVAVPWPSQQQLRESSGGSDPQPEVAGTPSPATSKKKRKKRR